MTDSPEGTVSAADGNMPVDGPIATVEQPAAPPVEVAPNPVAEPAPEPPAAPAAVARKRGGAGRLIAIALLVIFVLGIVGGGAGYVLNANLSDTYSPQRAVLNYFSAQSRGDIGAMMAGANYLRGDGSFDQFFDKGALTAMMSIPQNRAISDVKIQSTRQVDDSTSVVSASMTWGGAGHSGDYVVHRNHSDTHLFFYNTWTVDIPYTRISFTLPEQPGTIKVDEIGLPSGSSTSSVVAIAGYHQVTMEQTPLYDTSTQTVNGVDVFPNVLFDSKISATATTAITAAINKGSLVCDAATYKDCPGHRYNAPNNPGFIYYLDNMPGYSEIDYTYYVFNYTGTFTAGMKLSVSKDPGLVYATGTCAVTMTVDGSRKYRFTGTWGANVTYTNGAWTALVYPYCWKAKA